MAAVREEFLTNTKGHLSLSTFTFAVVVKVKSLFDPVSDASVPRLLSSWQSAHLVALFSTTHLGRLFFAR